MFDHLVRQNINIPFGYDYFGQKVLQPGILDPLANPNHGSGFKTFNPA
jgi:hypothetical protein